MLGRLAADERVNVVQLGLGSVAVQHGALAVHRTPLPDRRPLVADPGAHGTHDTRCPPKAMHASLHQSAVPLLPP